MSEDTGLAVHEHVPTGSPSSPLVVLVHGSLDRSTSFARVLRRLADVHTVVYDRRGYHRSREVHPLHSTFEGHVDDLVAVVAGRPAVVVGHSYGGDVAMAAALRPECRGTIRAVAAYEPPMPWLPVYRDAAGTPRRGSPVDADPADPHAAGLAAEGFFRRMVGDASWERLSESAKDERRADGPALAAELRAIRLDRPPFDATALAVPATFGRGERSAGRHRNSVAWLVEHVPGAELVEVPGAAHGAHLTHPDAFAGLVRAALARASAG